MKLSVLQEVEKDSTLWKSMLDDPYEEYMISGYLYKEDETTTNDEEDIEELPD